MSSGAAATGVPDSPWQNAARLAVKAPETQRHADTGTAPAPIPAMSNVEARTRDRAAANDAVSSAALERPIVEVIQRFFQHLAQQQLDVAAELWDVPAFILGDAHVHGPMSRPQLERLLAEAAPESAAGQRPQGSSGPSFVTAVEGSWLGQRVARVRVEIAEQRFAGFLSGVPQCELSLRIDEGGLPKLRVLTLLSAGSTQPFARG